MYNALNLNNISIFIGKKIGNFIILDEVLSNHEYYQSKIACELKC